MLNIVLYMVDVTGLGVCTLWVRVFFEVLFFFLMIRRPPRSTQSRSSAASDVYKRQRQKRFAGKIPSFSHKIVSGKAF